MKVAFPFIGFQSNIGNQIFLRKGLLDLFHTVQHKFTSSFGFSCSLQQQGSQHNHVACKIQLRGKAFTLTVLRTMENDTRHKPSNTVEHIR